MNKFIFSTGGGLGDIYFEFFQNDFFARVKKYTESYIDKYLKLLIVSHNPNSKDLFTGQDWIDEVKQVEYTHTIEPHLHEFEGYTEIKLEDLLSIGHCEKLEVYLTEQEKEQLEELYQNRYVIIHPKAGQDDRDVMNENLIKRIIEINKEKGLKVYLIGANYDRIHHKKEINPFPDESGLVDLIDKLSVRQLVHLVKSDSCIGIHATHSAIIVLAWIFKKPNCCYYPVNSKAEKLMLADKNKWNFGKYYYMTQIIPIHYDGPSGYD